MKKAIIADGLKNRGGGGSRTPVLERAPHASTGLSVLLVVETGGAGRHAPPVRIPVCFPSRAPDCAEGEPRSVADLSDAQGGASGGPSFYATYAARARLPLLLASKSFAEC